MQVEGQHEVCLQTLMATGVRVSNTYPTCLPLGNSLSKERLMSDGTEVSHETSFKEFRWKMGMRSIRQLAG